jgi:NAD(P)H-hydrate epimerase
VLIFAGSVGMTVAATLCALAAMRSGVGLVVTAIPQSLNTIMEIKLTEALTLPLRNRPNAFCPESLRGAKPRIDWSDVVVFGPGVSDQVAVNQFGNELLKVCNKPLIIDADGLKIFRENLELIRSIDDLIITPHHGEFAMMTAVILRCLIKYY